MTKIMAAWSNTPHRLCRPIPPGSRLIARGHASFHDLAHKLIGSCRLALSLGKLLGRLLNVERYLLARRLGQATAQYRHQFVLFDNRSAASRTSPNGIVWFIGNL